MLRKRGKNSIQNMPKKNHRLDSAVVFPFYAIHTSTFRVFYASVFYLIFPTTGQGTQHKKNVPIGHVSRQTNV